jgi:molybdenum cofactor cytidylyltransferase
MSAVSGERIAVVLAAGAGSRFRGETHKLLALFRGRPVVSWALEHARAAGLDRTWVVTGAVDLAAAGVVPPGVEVLFNPRWAEGQATSLQVAVAAAVALGPEAAACLVVGLGDQPMVATSAWQAVASSTGRPIAVAAYGGQRRNPVRIDRECWDQLPEEGDAGARVVMRQWPELVMEVPCESDPADIDTVEDLESASASASSGEPGGSAEQGSIAPIPNP